LIEFLRESGRRNAEGGKKSEERELHGGDLIGWRG
jgi:hypothetical protein